MKDTGRIQQERFAQAADEAAGVMRALSNPSRLMILCRLVEGEMTVGEIETALGLGQAYVSQQLARLRDEGLVAATREGRQMRYRIADPRVRPVMNSVYDAFCPHPAEDD